MDRRGFFRGAGASVAAVAVAPAIRLTQPQTPTVVLDHTANEAIIDELVQRDLKSEPVRDKTSNCPRCFRPGQNTRVGMGGSGNFGVVHLCSTCDVTWKV